MRDGGGAEDVAPVRVLVVDDDPAIRDALRELFEDEGYAVAVARDGEVAWALLRDAPAAYVVLTDHQMPRLDGAQLLRRVQADPALAARHAYVYMTAGNRDTDPRVRRILAALGAPVIHKPFDVDEMVATVEAAARSLRAVPICPLGAGEQAHAGL